MTVRALTIAGSDSGGGAGIQADLKAFAARGVYGMSAVTALTAQNTKGVFGIHQAPAEFVRLQIDTVMEDIGADAWKTGMLANAGIIKAVARAAREWEVEKLVVDPVMVAKSGDPLLPLQACRVLIDELLPLTLILTPNLDEAGVLAQTVVETREQMEQAAEAVHILGPRYVVIKGGHWTAAGRSAGTAAVPSQALDVLYDGRSHTWLSSPWINTVNTHGTGCTFASALAAELAKNQPVEQAVRIAKDYLTAGLQSGAHRRIGKGHGPPEHFPATV